jgi:hypothetical protein
MIVFSEQKRKDVIMSHANRTDSEIDSAIAALAYQLWMDRGCPIGSPEEDWLRAESELMPKASSVTA